MKATGAVVATRAAFKAAEKALNEKAYKEAKEKCFKAAGDHDMKNHGCAAERFDQILKDYGLPKGAPEPKRIHASQVLPSPFNRLGRPLNMPYIHNNLIASIGGGPGQLGEGFFINSLVIFFSESFSFLGY